jgi:hypothetical protein
LDNGGRALDLNDAVPVVLGPADDRFGADGDELGAFLVAEIGQGGDFGCISEEAAWAGADVEDGGTTLTANLATALRSDGHVTQ